MAEEEDEEPQELDFRFTLANERTFLAWIRTALALLAGAVGLDQLTPDLAPAPVRITLSVLLAAGGAGLGVAAYHRWVRVERAMRAGGPLPATRIMLVLTVCTAVAAAVFSVLIVGWSR
ncbi:YidH family protein [Kitasatospora phosalacinea]|uniref:YidH family protein n=1 Tax=Kitasatospora phosalacinea TaxID=2065 RepID=UPI003664483E